MKLFRYLIPEILYWFAKITKRNKKLYEFAMKLLKIYGRHSRVWNFESKNYLGRMYLVRNYPMGGEWCMYEDYGIKWGVEYKL